MRRTISFSILWLLKLFINAESANIVYLTGIPSPSHGLWNFRLIESLAAHGHNITVLSIDKVKKPMRNVHVFDMVEAYDMVYGTNEMNLQSLVDVGLFDEAIILYEFMYKFCQAFGETKGFKALLQYPDDFKVDLIINDATVCSCLVGFMHKFKYPPLVNVSPYKYVTNLAEIVGGHQYVGYIPRPVLRFSVNMTLMQRIQNAVVTAFESVYFNYIFQPEFDKLISSIFHFGNLPSSSDMDRMAAVTLLNTHPATDYPVPLPPNVIEVGGLQIRDPKQLPGDIEEFFTNSKKGAVLISFGTNVRADLFGDAHQNTLINVVKMFPDYHFLWKFERDPSEGKVKNLVVKSWVPQNDVLAHHKLKAFVSHCGGLSTHETTWYGIPIIAVPFFMDQKTNAYKAVLEGVGIYVNIKEFTVENFERAIRTIIEDPSYSDRMKQKSMRFKTRPMKPIETALWWIEYVLNDTNPFHLRSPILYLGEFTAKSYDLTIYGMCLIFFSYLLLRYFKHLVVKLFDNATRQKHKLS